MSAEISYNCTPSSAQIQRLEVDAALVKGVDQVNHVVTAAAQTKKARPQHRVPLAQQTE